MERMDSQRLLANQQDPAAIIRVVFYRLPLGKVFPLQVYGAQSVLGG
jgi:hypothetical protein